MLAQGRLADAAEAIAELDARPPPATRSGSSSATRRARLAAQGRARSAASPTPAAAVAVADTSSLIVCAADAHRTFAGLLWATNRTQGAADHARRALRLDEAKGNCAAAAPSRRRFAPLLGPHPGVQTQEGVKSASYTDD